MSKASREPGSLRLRRVGPLAVLLTCAVSVVWPLFSRTPLSHDHPTHLFRAWHFWNEMLAHGRLLGFTHYWGVGSPWGELAPSGGEAWVGLFRVLTFGQLSWLRTYSIAVAGMLVFHAFAGYSLVSRYFGRSAGAIAGLLLIFDPGAWAQGGWEWSVDWGTWPVTLSMAFVMMALSKLELLVERGRARDLIVSALYFGAALVTHQLALIAFAVTIPFSMLDHRLRVPRSPVGAWLRVAAGAALGVGVSASFTLPMLARSAFTRDLGFQGMSVPALLHELANFETFARVVPPILGFGVAGGLFGARARLKGAIFFAGSLATFVLLSSNFLTAILHLERVMPSVVKIESLRMILAAKIFLFGLAAHGIVTVARMPIVDPAPSRVGSVAQRVSALVLLSLPMCWVTFAPGVENVPAKSVFTAKDRPDWPDLLAFLEWSKGLPRGPGNFYRVAYFFPYQDHIATLAPVFNGLPFYKVGYTAAQPFRSMPETAEPEVLATASVKYILSSKALPEKDFVFERRFGELWFYRLAGYRPEPFVLTGPGQARLLEFSPERIRIALDGTAPATRLKLNVAYYDRWQAFLGGRSWPIARATVLGHDHPFLMEVQGADGELVFTYVRRTIDWIGLWGTLLSFSILVLLAFRRMPFGSIERWSKTLTRLGFASALVGIPAFFRAAQTRAKMLPPASLFHHLPDGAMTLGTERCVEKEPLVFACGPFVVSAKIMVGSYAGHLCMNVPKSGPQRLTLRTHTALPFLSIFYEPDPDAEPKLIRVSVDGQPFGSVLAQSGQIDVDEAQFDLRGTTGNIEVALEGSTLHCFDVRSSGL